MLMCLISLMKFRDFFLYISREGDSKTSFDIKVVGYKLFILILRTLYIDREKGRGSTSCGEQMKTTNSIDIYKILYIHQWCNDIPPLHKIDLFIRFSPSLSYTYYFKKKKNYVHFIFKIFSLEPFSCPCRFVP